MSGVARLPLHEIRRMMDDGRVWCVLGKVIKPDENGAHYYKDTTNGKSRVMIEVETIPDGMDLTCRLATRPTYYIPPVGALVAVLIPSGELEHCPLVVGVLDNGAADDEVGTDKTLVSSEVTYVVKAPAIKHGENASQAVVRGDEQKAALNSFLDALEIYIGPSGIGPIVDPPTPPSPVGPKTVALQAAITVLKTASWLSPKVKTE